MDNYDTVETLSTANGNNGNNEICVIDIAPFLVKAKCLASKDTQDLFFINHELRHEGRALLNLVERSANSDFSIIAKCDGVCCELLDEKIKTKVSEYDLNKVSNAIRYALMDLKDKESNIYKDIIEPFIQHKNEREAKAFYLETVITGIVATTVYYDPLFANIPFDVDYWRLMASVTDVYHFRFVLPCDRGLELWCISDYYMIKDNAPFVHLNIWGLGSINIINYVLGPYYYHLATYCPNVELVRTKHLYEWSFERA